MIIIRPYKIAELLAARPDLAEVSITAAVRDAAKASA